MRLKNHASIALRVLLIAYALNVAWEWLERPLYVCGWGAFPCFPAIALVNAGIIAGVWATVAIAWRKANWASELEPKHTMVAVSLSLLLAWLVELCAAALGILSHANAMPIVPGLGIGIFPLVQLPIITLLTLWTVAETQSDK